MDLISILFFYVIMVTVAMVHEARGVVMSPKRHRTRPHMPP